MSPHDEANVRWHFVYTYGVRASESTVALYKGDVRHHLTGGNQHSHHYENWLFGALDVEGRTALFPVQQRLSEVVSEFDIDASAESTDDEELFLDKLQLTIVSDHIGNLPRLKKIWLSNNLLDDASLPSSLARLHQLEFMCLTHNRFQLLPRHLPINLQYLLLDHNPLDCCYSELILPTRFDAWLLFFESTGSAARQRSWFVVHEQRLGTN
jgi:hypothetical protein